ncbi:MAG: M24 family metallopeptidase [Acidobacteria bacterium]|nr:M24 family metallopeptidase [Acidobacteriota bacterium]
MMNDLTARSVLRFALAVAGTVTLAAIAATCLTLAGPVSAGSPEGEVDHEKIRRDRIKLLLPEIMKEQNIDAWLTFTRENTPDPILPIIGIDHIVARGAFIFARDGKEFRSIAIAASYDVDPIHKSGLYDEVIAYKAEGVKPHLRKVIDALAPKRIAINYSRDVTIADGLTVGLRAYLDEALGLHTKKFISSERLVVSLLGRKMPEEIAALERAAEGTQRVIREALTSKRVKPGVTTENDLNDWMMARAKELGFGVAFTSVVVGPQRGHSEPTDRVIERGDVIRIDWGASYGGYCADIQRTAYVLKEGETEAPAWLQRLWDATLAANRAAVAALKPGNTGNDVDTAGRGSLVDAGFPEYPHGTGHAIGLKVHDVGPMLGPDWPERYGDPVFFKIEPGQVFAVEPLIYIRPDEIGYDFHTGLEENLVVEKEGARYIGTPQTELILIR